MRIVIQRVKQASVTVDNSIVGAIAQGLLLFIGITHDDTPAKIDWCINKIINMRIFSDNEDKLNLSLKEVNGSILAISQFTLYADSVKGNRPSFTSAAPPTIALPLYEYFITRLKSSGIPIETGVFGADMQVSLTNDDPITIILEK
jgi:D-tyrosyl-tRNA(Tyr) deacylase